MVLKRVTILIALTTCLYTNCFSEDPRSYPPQGQLGFRGLDTKSSPTQIKDGRAQDLLNVQFTATLGLKKRKGYSVVNDIIDDIDGAIAPITGLYHSRLSNGTDYVLAIEGDKLFYDASGTWTQLDHQVISADQDYQFVFVTALDNIIMSNDVDVAFKWTGSGLTSTLDLSDLSTNAPTKFKCMAWFQNFLILGNTYENSVEKPTRVRWSNIGTIETWTEADRNDISELGGQEIEAFGALYDDLYIFLSDSIWKMTHIGGDEQFKFTKVVDGVGCVAKNSVQTITMQGGQRGFIFLDRDSKIYFFNGITLQDLSEIIEPTMDDLNLARLPFAVSENTGNEYRLYVSNGDSTTNNLVIVFNYTIGEWTLFDQIDLNAVARVMDSDNNEYSYGGNYKSFVYKLDDSSLDSDVDGATGQVVSLGTLTTRTISGCQVLYDSAATYTASGLMGGICTLTSGTGATQERVIADNTTTGVCVESDFTTTPDTTTYFSIGAIDAYYQTKDFDFGEPTRIKSLDDLFLWMEEQGNITMDVSYELDFAGIALETIEVTEYGAGALWDVGCWDVDLWGGVEAFLARVPLKNECRYVNIKFRENDIDEALYIYGYDMLYYPRKQK